MTLQDSKTILLVDDDEGIRIALKKLLSSLGYRVVTEENGIRALEIFDSMSIDIVLTDLYMPEMNGFELLAELKEKYSQLPVVVISGNGEIDDAISALRLGAWDFLVKPIRNVSILQLTLERCLEKAFILNENYEYRNNLEKMVDEQNSELITKSRYLEETNQALKNLLDQREVEIKAVEQVMVTNLKKYVFPYLENSDQIHTVDDARVQLKIIHSNIERLVRPVTNTLGRIYNELTPAEIRVADFIRQGQSTKSIADSLFISPSTVENHRNNIRKKIGLSNKKTNLYTFLTTLS